MARPLRYLVIVSLGFATAWLGCQIQPVEVSSWRVVPSGNSYRIEGTVVNSGESATNVRLVFSTPTNSSRPDFALEHRPAELPALELRIEGLRVGESRRFQLPVASASGYDLDRLETY